MTRLCSPRRRDALALWVAIAGWGDVCVLLAAGSPCSSVSRIKFFRLTVPTKRARIDAIPRLLENLQRAHPALVFLLLQRRWGGGGQLAPLST